MLDEIFNLENFNIIEDEENYYFFRALNNGDYNDINNNIVLDNQKLVRIRTDLERYEDIPIYSHNSEISLEEVYDHIKWSHRKDTNCISFTTNANVALTYGREYYHNQYAIACVKKEDLKKESFYLAGKYMIDECYKRINQLIENGKLTSIQIEYINKIDSATSTKEIFNILKDYSKLSNEYNYNIDKYYDYYTLNDEQNLEKNKLFAKIDISNERMVFKNENKYLFEAMKFSFTSSEVLHYKTLQKNFSSISPTTMDMFALLQQAKTKKIDNEKIKKLELKLLEVVRQGYILKNNKYGNYNTTINNIIKPKTSVSIEDVYNLTNGQIPYAKAYKTLLFSQDVINSKLRVYDLCNLLKEIINDSEYESVINEINEKCYIINPNFISRNEQIGMQLSDSICLSITTDKKENISIQEQNKVLEYINSLNREEKIQFIENNGLSNEEKLCDLLDISYNEKITLNQYYAEVIVDNLDIDEIYKGSNIKKELAKNDRERLISYFKYLNCKNMFDSLESLNLDFKTISNIIFNLVLSDGFKGKNLIDFSNSSDFKDIMALNIKNVNLKLNAYSIDRLLGIEDDSNHIVNTEISLRDYQQIVFDNLNETFETKKYAGVVLPTGAGKSFIAISEMMRYRNDKIVYFAPNNTILDQIRKHILKNVCNCDPIPTDENEINNKIKEVFPYLDMYCYQTLDSRERMNDENFYNEINAGLIIFDEAHRTGANEWGKAVRHLLKNNAKAKVLALTATPVRDVDNHNMIDDLALLCNKYTSLEEQYTKEELAQGRHYAGEMYLIEAIQQNLVTPPKIVTFDYNLKNSEQYQNVKRIYEEETDSKMKKIYEDAYNKMRNIVSKSEKEGMSNIIKKTFEENKKSPNGRYIIFLPRNNTNLSIEEYFKQQIEEVKEYFKDIDVEPDIEFLSSSKTNKDNKIAIDNFEQDGKHLKLLFAIDMLNEGVHVDKIDGIMMLRPLSEGSKILYSQQLGRVISSIDPNHEYDISEYPIVFDVYNNYLTQNMDREVNIQDSKSDLEKMRMIERWIRNHHRIPDINSTEKKEYNKAFTLKKIQTKYQKYLEVTEFSLSLSEREVYEITEILNIGIRIGLWDLEIPKRTINDEVNVDNFDRVTVFEAKAEQKEFLEIFKKVARHNRKTSPKLDLLTSLEILGILADNNVDIELIHDIISLNKSKTVYLKDILEQLEAKVNSEICKNILNDCKNSQYYIDEYTSIDHAITIVHDAFRKGLKIFQDYDVLKLRKMCLFDFNDIYDNTDFIDDKGFITNGPDKLIGLNIYTGTIYNIHGETYGNKVIIEDGFGTDGYYYYYLKDAQNIVKSKYGTAVLKYEDGSAVKYYHLLPSNDKNYFCTGKPYNLSYFDKDGYYYKLENGERVKTDSTIKQEDEKIYIRKIRFDVNHPYQNVIVGFDQYGNSYELLKNQSFSNPVWARVEPKNYYENLLSKEQDGTYGDENNLDSIYKSLVSGRANKEMKQIATYNGLVYFDKEGYLCEIKEEERGNVIAPFLCRVQPLTKITKDGYDVDGNYYELLSDGTRSKVSKSKYNENGLDIFGNPMPEDENFLDEKLFDSSGNYYCFKGSAKTDDKNVYNAYIKYEDGMVIKYLKQPIYKKFFNTQKPYNLSYFDKDGYYYKLENGERVKTNSFEKVESDEKIIIDRLRSIKYDDSLQIIGFDQYDNCYQLVKTSTLYFWAKIEPTDIFKKYLDAKECQEVYDENNIDKIYRKLVEGDANTKINRRERNGKVLYFDKKGYYCEIKHKLKDGLYVPYLDRANPLTKISPDGYDIDSNYHKLLPDGTREEIASSKYNEDGYDIYGNREIIKYDRINKNTSKDKYYGFKVAVYNAFYRDFIKKQLNSSNIAESKEVLYHVFDEEGYFYVPDCNDKTKYIKVEPATKISYLGIDKEGNYHDLLPDGTRDPKPLCTYKDSKKIEESYENIIFIEQEEEIKRKEREELLAQYREEKKKRKNPLYDENGIYTQEINGEKHFVKYNEYGFDEEGYYWEPVNKSLTIYEKRHTFIERIPTYRKYDEYGFDSKGYNKEQKLYNKKGFDRDGLYHELLLNGERSSTPSSKYTNPLGFDIDNGYHILLSDGSREQNAIDGIKIIEKLDKIIVNPKNNIIRYMLRNFDKDGYYYQIIDGKYVTKGKYDKRGFDIEGFYYEKQEDGSRIKTDKRYDESGYDYRGFNQDGIHYLTGLKYDENYFDKDGNNIITSSKYSINGYDIEGFRSDALINFKVGVAEIDKSLQYSNLFNSMPRKLRCVYIAEQVLSTPLEDREKIIGELKEKYSKTKYPLTDEEVDKNILAATVKNPSLREQYFDEIKEIITKLEGKEDIRTIKA